MTGKSTRRLFLAGAALAAPAAAAAAATAASAVGRDGDDVRGRLARLEDENAVRALRDAYVRAVNAGAREALAALFAEAAMAQADPSIKGLIVDPAHEPEPIRLAADTAVVRLPLTVQLETPIEEGGTLVEMARLQGDGVVRRTERRVLELTAVKRDGAWKIADAEWRAR